MSTVTPVRYSTPTLVDVHQEDHATLVTGEADHGRISFAIQIQDSAGLTEELAIERALLAAVEEVMR